VKRLDVDGTPFELRCPDSADAAAMAAAADVEAGVDIMLARCVCSAGGADELTPARRAVIAKELAALDPAAEILLDLALARSYHWSEAEILGLSEARRALYLEMALS
jgi:hypothetical protein